jgi:hypothetical protein
MATAITTASDATPAPVQYQSAEAAKFALMQRQAQLFAFSPLVPDALRKGTPQQAMANCYIAMTIADRMGEDRMTVMQNIHIIHGTAGFKTKYMIARANASGKFRDDIDWEISGKDGGLSATAFATLAKSGKRVAITVDMAMAKAEGWTSNKKYQTMPEVMLRYRSASFLINLYAPEVMLGYQTAEEVEDISYAMSPETAPVTSAMLLEQARPDPEPETEEQGRSDADMGEAFTTTDAEADILAHLARKTTVIDINSLVSSRRGELDEDGQARVQEAAVARIAELKGRIDG